MSDRLKEVLGQGESIKILETLDTKITMMEAEPDYKRDNPQSVPKISLKNQIKSGESLPSSLAHSDEFAQLSPFVVELQLKIFSLLPASLKWRFGGSLLKKVRECRGILPPRVLRCMYGFTMLADPLDWLESHLIVWGDYEPGLSNIINNLLSKGDHFVDVGAHVGYFSMLAAQIVGESGHVYSFEPSPLQNAKLKRNVMLNNFSQRIATFKLAAGEKESEAFFYQGPENHSGISSLREIENFSCKFHVKVTPLDQVLNVNQTPVKFIKIDVEGAEFRALQGMKDLIGQWRPFIAMELTERFLNQFGDSVGDILKFLIRTLNYFPYTFDHLGRLCQITDEAILKNPGYQTNVLFTPNKNSVLPEL